MKKQIINKALILIAITFIIGKTSPIVLQEGTGGYTGCEDALIFNEKGKTQMDFTNKEISNPNYERMEIVLFTC